MTDTHPSRLQHFPVAWFAMIMGLGGLTLAWQRTEDILGLGLRISPALQVITTLLFLMIAGFYAVKALKYRQAVMVEWQHPVKMSFVPTLSIALILLSIVWLPASAPYSKLLWSLGTVLHLGLTLYVMTQWIHQDKFQIAHLNPAWFIPVVGNILVPVVGVHHAPAEISWFFFSIGLIFWPVLMAIIFYRVIFHGSLPQRLMPTLFILIAPPAVGCIAWVKLNGGVDAFAHVLFNGGLFFTLLLIFQFRHFARLKFFLSWWAYSFPLAAITLASLLFYKELGSPIYLRLSAVLLALTSVVILGLVVRTAMAVARKEICVEE